MWDTPTEVLVIDDSETYARTCASLIEKACGLKAQYAIFPERAEELLRSSPIKVIIFDQKMPVMTGTSLYRELKKIDPYFRSILLTGEATKEEILDAHRIGFDELMIKDKDNHLLTSKVLDLIIKYNDDRFPANVQHQFCSIRIGGRFSKHYIRYSIASIQIIDNEYISQDSWVTSDQIRAGESKEIIVEEDSFASDSFSKSIKSNFDLNLITKIGLPSFSIDDFTASLSKEIEQFIKADHFQSIKLNQRKTWSMSLPADGEIAYERFEVAPVFQKARIFINTSFSWSQKSYMDFIELLLPTSAIKGRIFRCYKDGKSETIDLQKYKIPTM